MVAGSRRGGGPTTLLEDRFTVASVDNSKFEKVSRVRGRSAAFDAEITVDINTSIFPVKEKEILTFAFAEHVKKGTGATGNDEGGASASPEMASMIDDYEYVCYGKVFNEEERPPERRAVYLSFGGLLCGIIADKAILSEFVLDRRLFILMNRSSKAQ